MTRREEILKNEFELYATEALTEDSRLIDLLKTVMQQGCTEHAYVGERVLRSINDYINTCIQQEKDCDLVS